MAVRTDLYSILIAYANKNNSPYIGIDAFLEFIEQYAKNLSQENPEWLAWVRDKAVKFWKEMPTLVEEGKCELLSEGATGRVYIPSYHLLRIQKAYENADADASTPFHNEESLGITIPESQTVPLDCEGNFLSYLTESRNSNVPLLSIRFPDGVSSALVLANMIPRRIAEIAILKIRNYLRKGGNSEYILRKLIPQLQGRESNLRDKFNQILIRPLDCYKAMEEGGEFACLFWTYFCAALKSDIKLKKDFNSTDIAAIQSAYIVGTINGYYKALAVKRREKELAFRSLESHLAKPPFYYTLEQICKFTSDKGVLLLSQYSKNDLEEWLKRKTTESEANMLPHLLIIRGTDGAQLFILKNKAPALCSHLLALASIHVKEALSKHWRSLLSDFRSEPAMENNEKFEAALAVLTKKHSPLLAALLEDSKLSLVFDEVAKSSTGISAPENIFAKGELLPYSSLLRIRRKQLLSDAKLMLPLWYAIPILSSIIAFFKKLAKGEKNAKASGETDGEDTAEGFEEKDYAREIRIAAQALEAVLIPQGHTLDSYMEELETRWGKLLDKQGLKNLIEDVKSLIRDSLRKTLRYKKQFKTTHETVNEMAKEIIYSIPALASLSGKDSLILYAELYLVKLMGNIR
jgi:hypothetical protein